MPPIIITVSARHAWAGSCQAVPGERMGRPIKRAPLHKVRDGVVVALRAVIVCFRAWEGWEHRDVSAKGRSHAGLCWGGAATCPHMRRRSETLGFVLCRISPADTGGHTAGTHTAHIVDTP